MNAVWNSYGQLCGCPEIFKKSCKFFCRELDIRVPEIMGFEIIFLKQIMIFIKYFLHTPSKTGVMICFSLLILENIILSTNPVFFYIYFHDFI